MRKGLILAVGVLSVGLVVGVGVPLLLITALLGSQAVNSCVEGGVTVPAADLHSGSAGGGKLVAAKAALAAGFTPEEAVTAVAIAGCESGWDPVIKNQAGSSASGMWQTLRTHYKGAYAAWDWRDPYDNARMARVLYLGANGNWSAPWVCHANGGYKKYLAEARSAVAAAVADTSAAVPAAAVPAMPASVAEPAAVVDNPAIGTPSWENSRPITQQAWTFVLSHFGPLVIGGWAGGTGHIGGSKHYSGLAIDVMTNDNKALGYRIANYFIANHDRFGVENVIFDGAITNAGRGWKLVPGSYGDHGNRTANHEDHPHIDFHADAKVGGAAEAAPVAADAGGCVPCPTVGVGTILGSAPARGGSAGGVRVDTALSRRSASDGSTTVDGEKVSRIAARQLQLAEQESGIDLTVMQGGYADQQHFAASGSSHNYPGVVDVSPGSVQVETLLRRYGFAAWARNIPGRPHVGKGAHVHAVSLLDPGDRTSPQVYGSWAGHRDGLGGGPGSDPAPRYAWVPGLAERVGGVELTSSSGDSDTQPGLQPSAAQCSPGAGAGAGAGGGGGGSLSALGPADGPSYELATFNILGANHHRGAPWRTRLTATKRLLAKHGVDVAALQEVHPPQSNALPALVGGTYARYYTAKSPDNQLLWRRDMFTLDRTRSRMLPVPYFGGHPKPMPMVRLVHKATGRGAWYIGVHNPADVHGPAAAFRARAVQLELQAARAATAATGEPVYLLGDMNDKQRFATMIRGKLRSAMVPGYTGIDWITQTGDGTAGRAVVDDSPLVDLASDHPFVVARVATGTSTSTGGAVPVASSTSPTSTSTSPSPPSARERWAADVQAAMRGADAYIANAARTVARPAINLDIDNTSLATEYATGRPVGPVLQFARTAHRNGVAVLFNTGRWEGRDQLVRQLRSVGYPVDGICLRTSSGEPLAASKQRCRTRFKGDGYQFLANVGNRATDFTGGGYGRSFKLPDNSGRLS